MDREDSRDLAALIARVDVLVREVESLKDDVRDIRQAAERWKGGFLVIIALGGVITWLLNTWSKLAS